MPGDLSLVGFDDGAYAEDAGLTTIHQNPVALGMAAAQMALTLIDGRTLANPHETAPTHLVMRSSTAAPRD